MYSQDIFNQVNKPLEKVDILYPDVRVFEKTISVGNTMEVEFETSLGPPDYVFIHLERISKAGEVFDKYQPVIKTVALEFFRQDVKTVSDLNYFQLYNATRRNSNYRTDVRKNRREVGGVFFTKADLGNWSRYEDFLDIDTFRGKFIVKEKETVDQSYTDSLETAEKVIRDQSDIKMRVLFIYQQFGLSGTTHNLRFWIK